LELIARIAMRPRLLAMPLFAGLLASGLAATAGAQVCATPGRDGTATVSGTINSVWAVSANGTYGPSTTSLSLGARRGAAVNLISGDLALVIQMQCATITSTDSDAYGDGFAGDPASGFTEPGTCQAGRYQYVKAGPATSGTSLDLAGSPLTAVYIQAAADNTLGRRTIQVIRIPQYQDATLSGTVNGVVWDGSSGGVVALDVAGNLSFTGTIDADGLGFRGGGGRARSANDAVQRFRWDTDDRHAVKGEGIAGTPRFVSHKIDPTTGAVATITDQGAAFAGYPTGTGTTGDYARGAPGNAGGGGAFWNGANDNGGGGGGGNGGAGGQGGMGWRGAGWAGILADYSNLTERKHGFGGTGVGASVSRVVLGGGGGGGDNNGNSTDQQSSGANGGGIVMIRAGTLAGGGTINARGARAADNTGNDGGGGGGAGGSVVVIASVWSAAGLAVNVQGGRGGDAFVSGTTAHGPGGGGGGGVVIRAGTSSVNITGGATGVTNTGDAPPGGASHGAAVGTAGINTLVASNSDTPGQTAGYLCQADLAITKSNGVVAPATLISGATTTYTLVVSNNGLGAANGSLVTDPVVAGLTATAVTCTGATGSATCPPPANVTLALLQGSGIVIPTLPTGGTVTFTVTATVTATGL
jgi:uncharacterized repeat protein (TIGR01451 family)